MEENKITPQWEVGYKEVKNLLHNELGITKEQIMDLFAKIAKDEVARLIGQNGKFIRHTMKEILREEMIVAIQGDNYPRVTRNIWDCTPESRSTFNKFISDIAKEEILEMLRNQFEVGLTIQQKDKEQFKKKGK